jgi:hypothetical protein
VSAAPTPERLAEYLRSLVAIFRFDSDRKTLRLAADALVDQQHEIDRLRRLLALAAEHVPDDCDHHDEIREALR